MLKNFSFRLNEETTQRADDLIPLVSLDRPGVTRRSHVLRAALRLGLELLERQMAVIVYDEKEH
tara:strand:- start:16412 stop:16603 length:192 start_codon:yes stop_codon:yes gene_type:complete